MKNETAVFALFFGNRGFFPEELIAAARREMKKRLEGLGFGVLMLDEAATRHGAVETPEEGRKYARFLEDHRGRYDGVILCLPNFGDETGAIAALQDCGVPILVHAYPDEPDKMGFEHRRDAFCGKFSVMDVFYQYGLPFTIFPPHTVHPASETFGRHAEWFAAVCRIVNKMKRLTVGAVGARTSAFKTVRFDELVLQRCGVTTEVIDLSEVFLRFRSVDQASGAFKEKKTALETYANWDNAPGETAVKLAKLGVVLDDIIAECGLDALALRCWLELEKELQIAPCVLLSELNNRGIPAACEVDVGNAVMMTALRLASQTPATCLDWNNNYGDEPDKCILFHCGPVPREMMTAKGKIVDHPMFAKALGDGCGWGPCVGRIAPSSMTFGSLKTEAGKLVCYLGEGEITGDPIAENCFGCGGVAQIEKLQDKLRIIGRNGYRHHLSLTFGRHAIPVREALETYLNYEFTPLDK